MFNLDEQKNKIELFDLFLQFGLPNEFLSTQVSELNKIVETLKSIKVAGKNVQEYKEYNKTLQIFLECNKKYRIIQEELIEAFGINLSDTKEHYLKKKEAGEINNPEELQTAVFSDLIQKMLNGNILPQINKLLGFDPSKSAQLLKGLKDYEDVSNALPTIDSPIIKRYTLLNLYRDAHEMYLKVLKEIHSKINKKSKNNKELYDYFEQNSPFLMQDFNKELRHDVSHLLYDTRDQFSEQELERVRTIIFVKMLAGWAAYHQFLNNYFKEHVDKINKITEYNNSETISDK